LKGLPDVYHRHLKAINTLESAENDLLKTAVKLHVKKRTRDSEAAKKSSAIASTSAISTDMGQSLNDPSPSDPEGDVTLADTIVPKNKRPTHRLPLGFIPFTLPFIGKKVDSINWARDEIVATNELLAKGRALISPRARSPEEILHPHILDADSTTSNDGTALSQEYPPINSAFITFNQQIAAYMAKTSVSHHLPYRMTGRHTEVAPEDIIWGNLGMNAYEAKLRMLISYAATVGLIIVWAFPGKPSIVHHKWDVLTVYCVLVTFIGIVSNIHALCVQYRWLAWLCKLPSPVIGVIQGILPPVLLAASMMVLPIVLRYNDSNVKCCQMFIRGDRLLARFEGIPKKTGLELSLMSRFFIFQVIVSFHRFSEALTH
jgi:calcium permeable stress-gated cation channel